MMIALNLLTIAWIIATWVRSGFLAALNVFAYGTLVALTLLVFFESIGCLPR